MISPLSQRKGAESEIESTPLRINLDVYLGLIRLLQAINV